MTDPLQDFWLVGDGFPIDRAATDPEPEPARPALDLLGRPDLSVGGRNLADLLRPAYVALLAEG